MPDLGLQGLPVALSGSIPDPEELRKAERSELDFRFAIKCLVAEILSAGGTIVHGAHPTIMPILEEVAAKLPTGTQRKHVLLFPLRYYYRQAQEASDFVARHEYAEVRFVGSTTSSVQDQLVELRALLAKDSRAYVCVGGRGPGVSQSPGKPQVEGEIDEALSSKRAVYLVGGLGGESQRLYRTRFEKHSAGLHNGLTHESNSLLGKTSSPWEATRLVVSALKELVAGDRLPRWK